MQPYKNVSGQSPVESYETGEDFIIVKFKTPSRSGFYTYKYTNASAGAENIAEMKQLAEAGQGLSDFIQANVRKAYETKE